MTYRAAGTGRRMIKEPVLNRGRSHASSHYENSQLENIIDRQRAVFADGHLVDGLVRLEHGQTLRGTPGHPKDGPRVRH